MMGDSGREHVRCSKADWGEKRERRITPSPKPKTGTSRGSGRAEKWCRCQCHPQPHAPHGALPGRHSSPLAPTQAHLLRGPWGRKAVHKQGPRENAGLWGRSCSQHKARMPGRAPGFTVPCAHPSPKQVPGPSESQRASRRADRLRGRLCPCLSAQLSTRTLLTYQGLGGLERSGGGQRAGLALTEEERLNVRLCRLRRLCFLRLLRWLR